MFPLAAPPPDGGFLVLNDAQIGNLDLVCAIKRAYPRTRIYAQKQLPVDGPVARVMRIANPSAAPSGLVGHYARRFPDNRQILANAMRKLKAV